MQRIILVCDQCKEPARRPAVVSYALTNGRGGKIGSLDLCKVHERVVRRAFGSKEKPGSKHAGGRPRDHKLWAKREMAVVGLMRVKKEPITRAQAQRVLKVKEQVAGEALRRFAKAGKIVKHGTQGLGVTWGLT